MMKDDTNRRRSPHARIVSSAGKLRFSRFLSVCMHWQVIASGLHHLFEVISFIFYDLQDSKSSQLFAPISEASHFFQSVTQSSLFCMYIDLLLKGNRGFIQTDRC